MNNHQSNKEKDEIIKGHEYDGIQEYDNPLPGWWLTTFYGTIIFAALYYVYYTFMGGPTLSQELEAEMKAVPAVQSASADSNMTEDTLAAKFGDQNTIAQGKTVYVAKCLPCHAENGGGLIGPNLTDNHWINGQGTRVGIFKVISTGVTDKGMPAWEQMLKPEELTAVAAFVYSLKGTNVSGGKPPQGQEYK
ncbi:MAG: hypothetical protein BroJett040_15060 [Oligoflexia bacterium]|nr:MAG: hypothetical protein BroJett040_15060 [Oligoflexia bacterium]